MKILKTMPLLITLLLSVNGLQAAETKSLKVLLDEVKASSTTEDQHNKEREKRFLADFNQQDALLSKALSTLSALEGEKNALKREFDANELILGEKQQQLEQRKGDLGELFGVFRQTASDTQSLIYDSLISAQHPKRVDTVTTLAKKKEVPSIKEIEDLWAIMMDEIVGSSEVAKFKATVIKPNGEPYEAQVTRVGAFNVVTEDDYLRYEPSDGKLIELSRQPEGAILNTAADLSDAKPGETVGFALDPSRGALLGLLVQSPGLFERIQQGKTVGYAIIIVGLIGLFIALVRLLAMNRVGMQISRQQANMDQYDLENPLGRVLSAFYENQKLSVDVISRKLDEVIFKDASNFRTGIQTIKVLAAIAPLMGLLGTVTGMIGTFQAITLFGTGDPKLMAGGISQALVTTVLGLVVSIPLLLAHSVLTTRATHLTKILGEQAAGMVARQAEKLEKLKLS
jgi:biopolymer transport protein ExbB